MSENKVDWSRYLDIAAVSDVGMRRTNNQDSYVVNLANDLNAWKQRGHLLVVADGMGAHAAGELASRLAVDNVAHLYRKYSEGSPPEALKRAINETNAEIYRKGQANEEFHNMGTTCTVLTIVPQGAIIGHVGDSRAYRMRRGRLEQLTFDHSLFWEMREVNRNAGNNSDLSDIVPKNVITRSLGPYPDVKVDMEGPFPLQADDTFLICSDGLTGQVADDEIAMLLANLSPTEAAKALVDLANLRGGPDNITLIVGRLKASDLISKTQEAPIVLGANPSKRTVSPVWWAFVAAFAVAALLSAIIMQSPLVSIGCGVIALALLGRIAFQAFGMGENIQVVEAGKRFGRAPYASSDCSAKQGFVSALLQISTDLRGAAIDEGWKADLSPLDNSLAEGQAASQRNDLDAAIRAYARGISGVMDQIRRKKGT
jgi:PPM family protein phosphatase